MLSTLTRAVISEFEKSFDDFEQCLLLPTKQSEFLNFLDKYRGLPLPENKSSLRKTELSNLAFQNIIFLFTNVFKNCHFENYEDDDIQKNLIEIEKCINLSLYYWTGLNNKNYQFRTFVHFFNFEGNHSTVFKTLQNNYVLFLYADGICLRVINKLSQASYEKQTHEPLCLPISKIFELSFLLNSENERLLFARSRTIQRELFLLVDEWEYLNAILAVEYSQCFNHYKLTEHFEDKKRFDKIVLKMNIRRNILAEWCLESFCDFHEWITELILCKKFSEDLYAELDAISGVILSGVQKIFLPASISRHRYSNTIPPLFERFALSRLRLNSNDMSSHLLLQAARSAMGYDFSPQILSLLNKKTFEWTFAFDPSPALKAFSWCYNRMHQVLLTAILAICYFKKAIPNQIDNALLLDIAAILQMPDTFPPLAEAMQPFQNQLSISAQELNAIYLTLSSFIQNNIKKTNKIEKISNYIQENIKVLKYEV